MQRRWQSSGSGSGGVDPRMTENEFVSEDTTGLQSELVQELEGEGNLSMDAAMSQPLAKADLQTPTARIRLEKIERPPGRFDILTNSLVYRWLTTAAQARKVSGPMREWASELKYRTGVHVEVEPTFPDRLVVPETEGGYANADEVELTVYLFGSERGIFNCRQLMEAALDQDPAYVRLGVFRRKPGKTASVNSSGSASSSSGGGGVTINRNEDIEWLMLRRINRDLRPPDIPPISLKLPGKWTLLFEHYREAAVRTLWEETGITVDPNTVYPTACLNQSNPTFYWRVPVHYFVAEVPYEVEVLGPQVGLNTYMHHWDAQLLRQSPDPIDRAWAQLANPETGCAWMKVPMINELQRPLRGEDYMATRYTPPPYSGLNSVLGFAVPASEVAAAAGGAAGGADAEGAASTTAATEEVQEEKPTADATPTETPQSEPTPSS
ncbi:putative mitochondrial mitochondrial RNA binding complex 1 subunit,NUDIX hydrolase, conserved [Leptomonas pyrrhocoris]|uniref:Putative mitochondrial mitochondrial RNA binding complex 1 subunit,NUDIX hydrolase, conserved n=1 Tax=Leptomonas pyrrhocoris TaxID=157538 RepID=A0A0M9G8I3_LEPPY|nr:putative mitochondrial mitochondrial RNA binding complex 1 subunit,NUDIX hydrolase, conserved [Leptomonas pyrrhocoris]KPA84837.1 putative mitochondrial mitochondrial RNA binding complex 1 subunit,NUDIX hydrolase, conserved [Leptomonas pyrrhocoris]|eukprot:XP_015663276.1 putative mitochondrial mitochondrial RNA binding complex 1 subunit,NUDIX hydrolase, conserved [Leptomonas pyrrhocoris]